MALQDDIELLSSVPLFSGMNDDQLRLVAFGAERRHLSQGQILFRENSPAECAYVVASGSFDLSAAGHNGRQHEERPVGRGTLLSELALVTLVERKYTASAIEESEVIRITRALFHRLMEEYPQVASTVENRIRDNIARLADGAAALQGRFV